MKKILVIVLMALRFKGSCLNADTLIELGLTPLDSPLDVESPEICKKILEENRTCVDLTELKEYMENI